MTQAAPHWKPIVAALANAEMRAVFARIVLEPGSKRHFEGFSPVRSERLVESLLKSGLIDESGGELAVSETVFRDALAAGTKPPPSGLARFMDGDRIVQFPSNLSDRVELLRNIAGRVLHGGEEISETEINSRLRRHSDDVAVLRRYLVDFGLVERNRDGTAYCLATSTGG